jgi:uncharacterized protein YjiS (DUF1127 family)
MHNLKAHQEIQELLELLKEDFQEYSRRLESIGIERREILRLFARRLEKLEVQKIQKRVKEQAYGKTDV